MLQTDITAFDYEVYLKMVDTTLIYVINGVCIWSYLIFQFCYLKTSLKTSYVKLIKQKGGYNMLSVKQKLNL